MYKIRELYFKTLCLQGANRQTLIWLLSHRLFFLSSWLFFLSPSYIVGKVAAVDFIVIRCIQLQQDQFFLSTRWNGFLKIYIGFGCRIGREIECICQKMSRIMRRENKSRKKAVMRDSTTKGN